MNEQNSITPHVKAWFGNEIQRLAMLHDLIGPNLSRVTMQDYEKQLVDDLNTRARAAVAAKELECSPDQIERYSRIATEELIRIRQMRAAHKAGELLTEVLRRLSAYSPFRDYFEYDPALVFEEVIAAAKDLFQSGKDDKDLEPLLQPGHPKNPVSKATRQWMEDQALGLACADDAWGAPFGTVPEGEYLMNSALRIRRNARQAMRNGDLEVPAEDVDKICSVAAGESYLLRSLRAAMDSGELPYEEIKRMPIFGPYRNYFEEGPVWIVLAQGLAVAAGLPIRPPDTKN